MQRSCLPVFLVLLVVSLAASAAAQPAVNILIFHRAAGFAHASIPAAVAAVQSLAANRSWTVVLTTDNSTQAFDPATLSQVNLVVFALTTGNVFDNTAQQDSFKAFINNGTGWVGLHSASDTEHSWSWYEGLVGAYFANHPSVQNAQVEVEDGSHPSTDFYPSTFSRHDEWYNFQTNPRDNGAHILLRLNEGSYSGGNMGEDHPIAWCKEYEGGRAWYTAGGHTTASYSEPLFLEHIAGGIEWAAGVSTASCSPSPPFNSTSVSGATSGASVLTPFISWLSSTI